MMDEFLLALQIFVQTNGLIFNNGVGNFQAPLELLDNVALRAAKDHVYEKTLAMFRHAIGQPARAPLLGFLDFAAVFGGGMLECRHDLADFFLRRSRPADENQVVQTLFHIGLTPFLKLELLETLCSGGLQAEPAPVPSWRLRPRWAAARGD